MTEQQAPLKTYRGNCHCAAFVYEITLPAIKQASECNCSICYKKAALWVFPKPSDVKFVKGDPSDMTNYTFNKNQFTHKFCSTCGVSLMVVGHLTPPKDDKLPENGFNVRTFQHGQVDVWKLETKAFDGKALPSTYEVPKFKGAEPTVEVEGGEVYTGGCHCGGVTVALKSKPINKDFQGLLECNCSMCGKYGATWIYQPHEQFVFNGWENLQGYTFNKKLAVKLFCKTCGIPICSQIASGVTDEQVAKMDENTKNFYASFKTSKAFNLRVLDDLNVKDLSPEQFDGYNFIQPGYAEP